MSSPHPARTSKLIPVLDLEEGDFFQWQDCVYEFVRVRTEGDGTVTGVTVRCVSRLVGDEWHHYQMCEQSNFNHCADVYRVKCCWVKQ